MNFFKLLTIGLLASAIATSALADDKKAEKQADGKLPKTPYPLKTCVVSDEKLGDMGDPFKFKHQEKEVQLCCKACKKDFDKSPAKFMKKLADAEKKATKKS